jgi:hypothetical protein
MTQNLCSLCYSTHLSVSLSGEAEGSKAGWYGSRLGKVLALTCVSKFQEES